MVLLMLLIIFPASGTVFSVQRIIPLVLREYHILSEGEPKCNAETVFSDVGMMKIAQATIIIHLQDAENVLQANTHLHIRFFSQRMSAFRKQKQMVADGWVVIRRESSPDATE